MLNESDSLFLKDLLHSLEVRLSAKDRKRVVRLISTFLEDRKVWKEPTVTAEEIVKQKLREEGAEETLAIMQSVGILSK
ncbi:MAG: hypothetical protein HYX23_00095 [Candidatus Zambryskibacteria bacterium]|nr:hypothetical protein [Candidatus Zambryskibacteria bacterium]